MCPAPTPCDPTSVVHETYRLNGRCYDSVIDPVANTRTTTTPGGRTSETSFDAVGRVASLQSPVPAPGITYGFGASSFVYDTASGQQTLARRLDMALSPATERDSQFNYYGAGSGLGKTGNLSSIVDALSQSTSYASYDRAGRVLALTRPDGGAIGFGYDLNGNLTSLLAPASQQTFGSSTYFHADHLLGYSSINQLTSYHVDDADIAGDQNYAPLGFDYFLDRQAKQTNRVGDSVSYARDASGRLYQVSYPDPVSVSSATLTTTYNYDTSATGRLLSVTGPDVTLTYGYLGSIPVDVTWSGAISANLHRDLDTATVSGRAVSDLVTANETVTVGSSVLDVAFGYDADGVLASASAGGVLSMSRYPGTTLLHSVSDSIATETYTPNGFGETQDYGATVGSSTLFSEHYDRDALGRITGKTEQITDGAGGLDVDSVTYGYDAAGRLWQVTRDSGVIEYDYDANGNRLRRHTDADDELGTYNVQDRLLTYGSLTFGYGANGEVTSVQDANLPPGADTTTYTYDALGNLRQVVLPDGTTIAYLVDGQNRRVGKTVNGTLVRGWIYEDQLRIAAELELDTGLVKRFVYGSKSNVPDAMVLSTGQRYRILSDHLGSPRVILDSTGAVVERVDYDEYGRRTVVLPAGEANEDGEAFSVPFGFAGGLRDVDSGLVRFGARDYDPRVGRWMSKDPLLLGGGSTNVYAYAGNDPLNRRDPGGMTAPPAPWWVFGGESTEGLGALGPAGLVIAAGIDGAALGWAIASTIWPDANGIHHEDAGDQDYCPAPSTPYREGCRLISGSPQPTDPNGFPAICIYLCPDQTQRKVYTVNGCKPSIPFTN